MTRAKGIKRKGNGKQSISQQTAVTVDAKIDREAVTNLKSLNERLLTTITNERKEIDELKKKLEMFDDTNTKLLETITIDKNNWDCYEKTMKSEISELKNVLEQTRNLNENHEKLLQDKMTEDKQSWDSCKEKLDAQVLGLQNELNETRVFSQGLEELCTKLRQGKTDLEDKLKEFNNRIKELEDKMSEGGRKLEGRVVELEDEFIEAQFFIKKHEELWTELMKEKNELENKVKEYNDETEELKAKMSEGGRLWDSCKTELEVTVAGLQNELNETRVLSLKHEEACTQLRHEKIELKDQLKELNNRNGELHAKMAENGCFWDTCKANLEGTNQNLQKMLNETRTLAHNSQILCNELSREKTQLENNLNHSINETKQLKEKMVEDAHLWDTCKGEFEVTVAKLQNELNEVKILSQKHQDSWSQSGQEKKELEMSLIGLQNELEETKILSEKHQEVCNVLREENQRLGNKLNQCNDRIGELNTKIEEDGRLWDTNKADLESKVAGLEHEKKTLSQDLEYILRECNDMYEKLHAQMREDCSLWEACKAKFEDSVSGLQKKLDLMSNKERILRQEYVELCSECEFLKVQLGVYNDTLSSVENERLSLMSLSDSNAKRVEALQTQVQLITDDRTHLSKKYEELTTENEALKLKLENYEQRLDSVENERSSLISTSGSMEEVNGSLEQKVQQLQNKLGMWDNDYKRVSTDDILDSATGERQLLISLSETSDKLMEDLVIENTTVKQEALRLDQQNQLSQKDILNKNSLLQTKDGKITELNANIVKLKNELEKLEEVGRKNTKILKGYGGLKEEQVKRKESEKKRKEGSGRVLHRNQTAFIGNLMSCILLDNKSTVSRCLSSGIKRIILPSDALLSGYPYGWFGGIV